MSQKPVESPAQIQIMAGGIMASVLIHAVVGVWLTRNGVVPEGGMLEADGAVANLLVLALGVAGLVVALLSFAMRRILLKHYGKQGFTLQSVMQVVILSLALAEAPGVLGLGLAILTGTLTVPAVLWGVSFAVSLFHFPTTAWIENLLDSGGSR